MERLARRREVGGKDIVGRFRVLPAPGIWRDLGPWRRGPIRGTQFGRDVSGLRRGQAAVGGAPRVFYPFGTCADFVPDGFIPASATSVSVFHWDIVAAAAAYGFAYDEVYGEGYEGAFDELLDSIEKDADGPESNVRQDIIRRLASKVISASDYAGPKTPANPSGRRTLLACRTDDAAKTATAIERFFAGEKEIDVVVDHGVRVWQAKRSEARLVEADAEDPWSVNLDALCVAHGHFMVATDRTLLHEIRKPPRQPKPRALTTPSFVPSPRRVSPAVECTVTSSRRPKPDSN